MNPELPSLTSYSIPKLKTHITRTSHGPPNLLGHTSRLTFPRLPIPPGKLEAGAHLAVLETRPPILFPESIASALNLIKTRVIQSSINISSNNVYTHVAGVSTGSWGINIERNFQEGKLMCRSWNGANANSVERTRRVADARNFQR